MNQHFKEIRRILEGLKSKYASFCGDDVESPEAPVTERDIVAEIYQRLKAFRPLKGYQVHCEIKPASSRSCSAEELKSLPRVDVVVLSDKRGASWLAEAKELQDKFSKGEIEARLSSVPVKFFHTAIEVKIQSDVRDAKKDIDKLARILGKNPSCNCFLVLLNARGKRRGHNRIAQHGDSKGICVLEYTSRK